MMAALSAICVVLLLVAFGLLISFLEMKNDRDWYRELHEAIDSRLTEKSNQHQEVLKKLDSFYRATKEAGWVKEHRNRESL